MRASKLAITTVAILIGAAIAAVAPAAGQDGAGKADRADPPAQGAPGEEIVLRRAGDRAVPFEPAAGAEAEPVLRRDASRAVPFVPEVDPRPTGAGADGFDWGDAAIGAGAACALILLAAGVLVLIRRRRPRGQLAERPA